MRLNLGAVLVGCLVWVACEAERPPAEETKARPDVRPYVDLGGDFVLVDQAGEPFALKDLRGQAALLFFGYTFCPDFCPTTLSRLGRVHELMGIIAWRRFLSASMSSGIRRRYCGNI